MPSHTLVSIVLPHGADDIWSVMRDFGDYRWGEGVGPATVDGDDPNRPGAVRRFAHYGRPSAQRLTAYDADARTMSWESVEPFDETLRHYAASLRVIPVTVTVTDESFVAWSIAFDAAPEAVERWRRHQQSECRKSLERLSIYAGIRRWDHVPSPDLAA